MTAHREITQKPLRIALLCNLVGIYFDKAALSRHVSEKNEFYFLKILAKTDGRTGFCRKFF